MASKKKRAVQRGVGMNNLYFACTDCKTYVDAGYRWASWWLEEPGVVKRGTPVSVDTILAARDYWSPGVSDGAQWLHNEVLPAVRRFLEEHRSHQIVFGPSGDFLSLDSSGLLDWMQVGFLPLLLPRYFVERLGFKTWDQVSNFIARHDNAPWWWMLEWEDLHKKARKKFMELVESETGSRKRVCRRPRAS